MNAIGYVRCSTQEQFDSGLGLDVQSQRINAYYAMRGIELDTIVTDVGPFWRQAACQPGGRTQAA